MVSAVSDNVPMTKTSSVEDIVHSLYEEIDVVQRMDPIYAEYIRVSVNSLLSGGNYIPINHEEVDTYVFTDYVSDLLEDLYVCYLADPYIMDYRMREFIENRLSYPTAMNKQIYNKTRMNKLIDTIERDGIQRVTYNLKQINESLNMMPSDSASRSHPLTGYVYNGIMVELKTLRNSPEAITLRNMCRTIMAGNTPIGYDFIFLYDGFTPVVRAKVSLLWSICRLNYMEKESATISSDISNRVYR